MGNMKAGTVIDTGVCHPETHDYFLCSHGGLKGTSKPTHYHVMYDENNFTYVGLAEELGVVMLHFMSSGA